MTVFGDESNAEAASLGCHAMSAGWDHVALVVKVGDRHYEGVGTHVDLNESTRLHRKAADQGNAQASKGCHALP